MPTIHSELRRYAGAIRLERLLSRTVRKVIVRASLFLTLLFACIAVMQTFVQLLPQHAGFFAGLACISGAVYLKHLLLSLYWNAHYFWGIMRIGNEDDDEDGGITYEVAEILSRDLRDVTSAFLTAWYGEIILMRAGVPLDARDQFLAGARTMLPAESIAVPSHTCLTFEHLASILYAHDTFFKDFLVTHGVREDVFFGAVSWVTRSYYEAKHAERWWGKDVLGKSRGIGDELSFGIAWQLRNFVKDLESSTVYAVFGSDSGYARDALQKIEQVLSRAKEANVLLVAEPGVGEIDMLATLAREMREGTSMNAIEGRHMMLFDTEAFLATYGEKQACEQEFIQLMNEASHAGNIVLVIEHITSFLENGNRIGVDFESLMDPYLSSPALQVIATADPGAYHQVLEVRPRFMQRFSPILIETPPLSGTVRILEDIAPTNEANRGIFFTYGALQVLAEGADRYIVEGVMPDKAVDLLVECAAALQNKGVIDGPGAQAFCATKQASPWDR